MIVIIRNLKNMGSDCAQSFPDMPQWLKPIGASVWQEPQKYKGNPWIAELPQEAFISLIETIMGKTNWEVIIKTIFGEAQTLTAVIELFDSPLID